MTSEQGELVSTILQQRCGAITEVLLSGNRVIAVHNVAWGRDMGASFDHFTSNISPPPSQFHTVDFFYANEVIRLVAKETGHVLFQA